VNSSGYRQAIIDYIHAQAKPPEKFSHQPRLHRLAARLAEDRTFDDDVLFAAAWMHDLGVFVGHRPEDPARLAAWDHVAYAIKEIPPLLQRFGFPAGKIPAVLEVIRTHQPSDRPTTFEGVLMRDADVLERLGAIGILRTVAKVGRDTRFAGFADALRVLQRNAEELFSTLELASARRLAEPRLKLMRDFLQAAAAEADGAEF
jgi:uncharacterized protein